MDTLTTEQEQLEAFKKWWQENGRSLIAMLVLGIGTIVGVRYWLNFQQTQSQAASELYEDMSLTLSTDRDKALEQGAKIVAEYSDTPYAVLASLHMAKLKLEADDTDGAIGDLRWVVENSSDANFEHIARLRLVRLLLSKDEVQKAQDLLKDLQEGKFSPPYAELRGNIYVAQNNPQEARRAYEEALAGFTKDSNRQNLLSLKLHDLAEAAVEQGEQK